MSKIAQVGAGVLVVGMLVVGSLFAVNAAQAQEVTPEAGAATERECPGGELSEEARTYLQTEMKAATAETLGMTVEELEAAIADGQKPGDIAVEQGMTIEEFRAEQDAARAEILADMVEQGLITQEQADWLATHRPHHRGGRGGRGGQGAPAGTEAAPQS